VLRCGGGVGLEDVTVWVHLNGRLVDEAEARVSVFDRGLLFGDGVFESMRAVAGTVFRLDRHLIRLQRSASLIGLSLPEPASAIGEAARGLLRRNGLADARIRVTVTRGPGSPGDYVAAPGPSTLVITASPFSGLGGESHARGVTVALSARRQIPPQALNPAIKSISRLHLVLARREAQERGAFEAILLDGDGHLTEGTASNLFLVTRGRLRTPPVPEEGLPGLTREAVIELAREAGIEVIEERLPARALEEAGEVFLTNTSWEVLPVVAVEGRPVQDGRPGPIASDLLARYRQLLRRECVHG
jgi:branched-chain amino acid aminotransferase